MAKAEIYQIPTTGFCGTAAHLIGDIVYKDTILKFKDRISLCDINGEIIDTDEYLDGLSDEDTFIGYNGSQTGVFMALGGFIYIRNNDKNNNVIRSKITLSFEN